MPLSSKPFLVAQALTSFSALWAMLLCLAGYGPVVGFAVGGIGVQEDYRKAGRNGPKISFRQKRKSTMLICSASETGSAATCAVPHL